MASIVLARVDSRLVHGQVVTKWVNQVQADRIMIVSDELVEDPFLLSIYEMSAPPGIKITLYSEKQVITEFNDNHLGTGNILLLFPNVETAKRVVENGLELPQLQIGGLGGGPNRKVVYKNITLDDEDFNNLLYIEDKDIKVTFQAIPEDNAQDFKMIQDKYK